MPHKGTTHAYKVSRESDKITPGTSTVATFETLTMKLCENFRLSQTQRQVNAFIMSWKSRPTQLPALLFPRHRDA